MTIYLKFDPQQLKKIKDILVNATIRFLEFLICYRFIAMGLVLCCILFYQTFKLETTLMHIKVQNEYIEMKIKDVEKQTQYIEKQIYITK